MRHQSNSTNMEQFPIYSRINVGHHREEYVKHISPYECVVVTIWSAENASIEWKQDENSKISTQEWDYLIEKYTPCTEAEYLEFLDRAYNLIKSK